MVFRPLRPSSATCRVPGAGCRTPFRGWHQGKPRRFHATLPTPPDVLLVGIRDLCVVSGGGCAYHVPGMYAARHARRSTTESVGGCAYHVPGMYAARHARNSTTESVGGCAFYVPGMYAARHARRNNGECGRVLPCARHVCDGQRWRVRLPCARHVRCQACTQE